MFDILFVETKLFDESKLRYCNYAVSAVARAYGYRITLVGNAGQKAGYSLTLDLGQGVFH